MTTTQFGDVTVRVNGVTITAHQVQLENWATRPGHAWPCSELRRHDAISCTFDANGLLELEDYDGPADEFNAWSSDVLRDAITPEHPCWFVTVGQFIT